MVPGNETETNDLLEKFMRIDRGVTDHVVPSLATYEIHSVTSCIKKFLSSLKDSIIPLSLWKVFVDAANNTDTANTEVAMYQAVSELPQPNRDTLAYLMIHLQIVVANARVNKMDVDNLSWVMGSIVVGYSSNEPESVWSEGALQNAVMRQLIDLSTDYWSNILVAAEEKVLRFRVTHL